MLRVRQKTMNDLRTLRELANLSQGEASGQSGVPMVRLSLAERRRIVLRAQEEFLLRRVLLAAIQKRVGTMKKILAGEWSEEVRI